MTISKFRSFAAGIFAFLILNASPLFADSTYGPCCDDVDNYVFYDCFSSAWCTQIGGGLSLFCDMDFDVKDKPSGAALPKTCIDFDIGYNAFLDVFYKYGPWNFGARGEWSCADIDSVSLSSMIIEESLADASPTTITAAQVAQPCGHVRHFDVTFFAEYNIMDLFECNYCYTFHVMAGLGVKFVNLDIDSYVVNSERFLGTDEDDTLFTGEFGARIGYPINNCWAISLGYRLSIANSLSDFDFCTGPTTADVVSFSHSNSLVLSQDINLALTYCF